MNAFQWWKQWASQCSEVKVFLVPCPGGTFRTLPAAFEVAKSKSAVEVVVNAISWVHQISSLPTISEFMFVRATLAGL